MLPSHVQLFRGDFVGGFYFVSLRGNLCATHWARGKQENIKIQLPAYMMFLVAKPITMQSVVILHRWAMAWIANAVRLHQVVMVERMGKQQNP